MKYKKLLVTLLSLITLVSCGETTSSLSSSSSATFETTSESQNSSSSSSSINEESQAYKIETISAQGILDFFVEAGRTSNYTLSYEGQGDTYTYIVNPIYYVREETYEGYILLDSFDSEKTQCEKLLYAFKQNEEEGLYIEGVKMNDDTYYSTPRAYNAFNTLLLSKTGELQSTYKVENILYNQYKDTYYVVDFQFMNFFNSMFGLSSYSSYITKYEFTVSENNTAVNISPYYRIKSTDDEKVLQTFKVSNLDNSKSVVEEEILGLTISEKKPTDGELSLINTSSYSFTTDFYVVSNDKRTFGTSIDTYYDGYNYYAELKDNNGNLSSYYHYINKNNLAYQTFINGKNKVIESPVTDSDSEIYAFDEWILNPWQTLDKDNFRLYKDGVYRYYGINADNIFMAFSFNSASSYDGVDQLDIVVENNIVKQIEFTFTGLSNTSNEEVEVLAITTINEQPTRKDLVPFTEEIADLETGFNYLLNHSFIATLTGNVQNSSGSVSLNYNYGKYIYDYSKNMLVVEKRERNISTSVDELVSRKGYKQDGDTLHYYDLSIEEENPTAYTILSEGYSSDRMIEDFININASSCVFESRGTNQYVSRTYVNPSDSIDFGISLMLYIPKVYINLTDEKQIETIQADYYMSSYTCYARISFDYSNENPLQDFVY